MITLIRDVFQLFVLLFLSSEEALATLGGRLLAFVIPLVKKHLRKQFPDYWDLTPDTPIILPSSVAEVKCFLDPLFAPFFWFHQSWDKFIEHSPTITIQKLENEAYQSCLSP